MSIRTLLVSAGLLVVVCGGAYSQPQPPIPAPSVVPEPPLPAPGLPPIPAQSRLDFIQPTPPPAVTPPAPSVIPVPSPPPTPPTMAASVENLLNELERVQAQKAELEKKEQELKAAIRKRLEAQAERLQKLGVKPVPAKEAEPDRVGRIIIEGNTKTPDGKILDKLAFHPGQVLEYPALEAARAKLEKAGFREVAVDVIPNVIDSQFKDIRVKITEPNGR